MIIIPRHNGRTYFKNLFKDTFKTYKVKIRLRDNDWQMFLVMAKTEQEAIEKVLNGIEEEYLVDVVCEEV